MSNYTLLILCVESIGYLFIMIDVFVEVDIFVAM